jgi:hypothetical protein
MKVSDSDHSSECSGDHRNTIKVGRDVDSLVTLMFQYKPMCKLPIK